MPRISPRWIVLLVGVLVALVLWRSGLLAELNLPALKERQVALQAWTAANPWLAAGAYFTVYVAATGVSLPGAAILTLANPIFSLLLLAGAVFPALLSTLVPPVYPLVAMAYVALIGARGLRHLRDKYLPPDPEEAAE